MQRPDAPVQPVASVAAVIVREGSDPLEVCLIKRLAAPGQGEWSIPGGAIELGEGLHEAAVREAREETGLTIRPQEVVDAVDRLVVDPRGNVRFHYVIVDFLARADGEPAAGSDAGEARWVSENELDKLVASQDLRRVLTRALARARQ